MLVAGQIQRMGPQTCNMNYRLWQCNKWIRKRKLILCAIQTPPDEDASEIQIIEHKMQYFSFIYFLMQKYYILSHDYVNKSVQSYK